MPIVDPHFSVYTIYQGKHNNPESVVIPYFHRNNQFVLI